MWVFDGEEWTQDNGSESSTPKAETDQMMPELQVIEIVPVQPRLPQVPLPTV